MDINSRARVRHGLSYDFGRLRLSGRSVELRIFTQSRYLPDGGRAV
jgi:hypothetical protein